MDHCVGKNGLLWQMIYISMATPYFWAIFTNTLVSVAKFDIIVPDDRGAEVVMWI
jgi:hypothetical protein